MREWLDNKSGAALVVLATGLGKTFVAGTAIRRMANQHPEFRVLVLAHSIPLLHQLEGAFWPFLRKEEATITAESHEKFSWDVLEEMPFVFGSRDTFASRVGQGHSLPEFDLVLVDECHHLMTSEYDLVLDKLGVGTTGGPFLLGLTATDWRPDGTSLQPLFGDPVAYVDLIYGLKQGFLTNVDYRMYTSNIDWDALRQERDGTYSPKRMNKTLFVQEWDNAVVDHIHDAWDELKNSGKTPRCIVFCTRKDYADQITNQLNALGFTRAEAIYSGKRGGGGPQQVAVGVLEWRDWDPCRCRCVE